MSRSPSHSPAPSLEARAQPITTMSAEEQNFHRLFPQVPQSEKLVEYCQCGLKRKVVRMGKLYVTSLRVCFQSSFLDSVVMLPWEDVANVEKRSSFMFDAIVVTSKANEEYGFTAFLGGRISQMMRLMKTLWSVRERYVESESHGAQTSERSLGRVNNEGNTTEAGDGEADREDMNGDGSSGDTDLSDYSLSHRREASSVIAHDEASHFPVTREASLSPSQFFSPVTPREKGFISSPVQDGNSSADTLSLETKKRRQQQASPGPLSPPQRQPDDASSRTLEVKRLFPNLPSNQVVTDAFQCSCVSGVHRLGKMYITQQYILFASVMLEENMQIAFEDVESIEKEQTMMILDGISVRLKDNKMAVSFTSFVSRDAVYNTLILFFKAVMREAQIASEATAAAAEIEDGPLVFKTATSEYDLAKIPAAASLEEFSKVTTDWGTALSDYTCFTKELMTPVPLPAGRTVLDVFRLCFDDETTVLEAYHRDRKDTAQKVERWRATTDGQAFRGQREYTCTTLVKAMMGKACPYTEYQRYAFLATPAGSGGGGGDGAARVPTLLVQFSSQISGVMFSDAFRAEALVVFTQAGEGDAAQVTMRAFGYVQFLRSVWVKGKISSRTLEQELPEAYRTLADMIVAELNRRSATGAPRSDGTDGEPGASGGASPEGGAVAGAPDAVVVMAAKPFRPLALFGVQIDGDSFRGSSVGMAMVYLQLAVSCLVLVTSLCGVLVFLLPISSRAAGGGPWASISSSIAGTISAMLGFVASQQVFSLYLTVTTEPE